MAAKIVETGAADYVGEPPRGAAPEIPAGWESLAAPDMIALAHKLGAGGEISTKAAAEEFIARLAGEKILV